MRLSPLLSTIALATTSFAQNVTNCVGNGVCYAVNVPAATASSGSGDIYIHVTGPSTLSWMGVGQGTGMAGANIFMIYANADGNNVTVSPRLGAGERQPLTNGATSQIALLGGSGIADGQMTANFKCSNCNSWSGGSMDFKSASSNWIWAYRMGQAVNSNDLSVSLQQHNQFGMMNLNLQSATGGSSTNPFLGVVASQTSSSNTGSGDSGSGSNGSGNSSGSSNSGSGSSGRSRSAMILMAHGILMSLAFAVLYPLGAIIIRLLHFKGVVWIHAGWMATTYLLVIAGMGLGVYIAVNEDLLDSAHAIIGLVVVGSLILQPVTGLLHHKLYKSRGGPNGATPVHVWWGRAIITLGIINGGLGLKLAANTRNGEIAYGVVAGVMWIVWMAVAVFGTLRKGRGKSGNVSDGSHEKMNQSHSRGNGHA